MAVDAPHTAALQVADDVFGELMRLGRVSVAVGLSNDTHPQPIIEVRPANSLACSVAILAMDAQIDLLLGPHETLREIYSRKASERLQELRQCLEAVAEGRYEETVEVMRKGAILTGRFRDGPKPYVRYGSDFGAPRVATFEPY